MIVEPGTARGFTLLELVVGIVLLSLALVILLSLFLPMMNYQSQPIYQVRATVLGQSMLDEATSRAFDEMADRHGGTLYPAYCGSVSGAESSLGPCTAPASYGLDAAEGGSRNFTLYNDVDDFDHFCASKPGHTPLTGDEVAAWLGLDPALYAHYLVSICVTSAPELISDPGLSGREDVAKQVEVTVTQPSGEPLTFTRYRSNY